MSNVTNFHDRLRGLQADLSMPQDDPEDPGPQWDAGRDGGPQAPTVITSTAQRTSRFIKASELEGVEVTPREWAVPGKIPTRSVTLFGGDGGTGKSLLASQLVVAGATGGRWIGEEVKPGRVIFLSAEDELDELHRRFADILAAEGKQFSDLGDLTIRSVAGEDALLAVESQVALTTTALFAELEAQAEEHQGLSMIVLDTLADLYPANENDRAKVRQFVSILRGLAIRQDCAVVLLSHPSLSGLASGSGTSGSTAWNGSVRSRLYLERIVDENRVEKDPDKRRLSVKKLNYGRIGDETILTYRDGVFVADEVTHSTGMDRMAARSKAERLFMAFLSEFTSQGRRVNHAGGSNYAPNLFADHPKAEGVTKQAFYGAMNDLLRAGAIHIVQAGSPSRPFTYLAAGAE